MSLEPKSEEEENSYMALRAAKMARNQARLKELGLVNPPPKVGSIPSKFARLTPNRSKPPSPTVQLEPVVLRRSSRLSHQSNPPNYKEKAFPKDSRLPSLPTPKRRRSSASTSTTISAFLPPPSNSVRSISLNVEQLLLGDKVKKKDGLLGQQVERTGKEFVIYQAFESASQEDYDRLEGRRLSFNKYCGVQEWQNAIFLWVNLGNKDNPVVNDFLDNAKQITWFGGSRMHDESPVILKLLKMGQQVVQSSSNIVLWCRKYQVETKQFTPYVCFGRLGYQSHVIGSHPLSFVWNLLDYEKLQKHDNKTVRDRFEYFTS